MKFLGGILIFWFIFTPIIGAPTFNLVKTVSYKNKVTDNSYEFSYELSDGQTRHEKGVLTRVGDAEVYEVTGSYAFEGTDGNRYTVDYTAGVDGYHATVKALKPTHQYVAFVNPSVIKSLVG